MRAIRPPLRAEELAAAHSLLAAEGERHPYAARAIEILDGAAAGGADGEYRALVATDDADGVIGVVLHGTVAGSVGAAMLHGAVVAPRARRHGVGRALVERAIAALVAAGARAVFCELPDDPALGDVRALLRRSGFEETGRVADLVRDGVAMVFWRRDAHRAP